MSKIGYARVSTVDQNPELQTDALHDAGCQTIFTEKASGAKQDRPELTRCLEYLRAGDTLVVWKLDRLGRSLRHLVALAEQLRERGVELNILTMGIDTATTSGRLMFNMFAALAEFERDLIRERTHAGLAAARARGRVGGRKPKLTNRQAQLARDMYNEKGEDGRRTCTVADIARELKVSRPTIYRYLEQEKTHAA